MEWFKHSTGSHEDPDISDAWDMFGDAGPLIFWTVLEVFGAEYSHLKDGWLTLSISYFERKTRRKFQKSEKILEFFQNRSRIYFQKGQQSISITIPKFIKIASNWTIRPKDKPTWSPTEAPTEAPTAKEEEEKKKRRRREEETEQRFKIFWESYPKRKSKGQAEKAFLKINPDEQLLETIVSKIEQAKTSEDWLKEKGKYIPYPATWLNAKGWEDELIINTNNKPTTPKDNFTDCKSCGKRTYKPDLNADGLCIKCENAANIQGVAHA